MGFPNWGWVLIRFSVLSHLVLVTVAKDSSFLLDCESKGGYNTQNSQYEWNVDQVLSSLPKTNNGYGFFTSSSGQNDEPNTAYAIALCLGDLDSDTCHGCVADGADQLRQQCGNVNTAGTAWSDECILSYSNTTLLYMSGNGDVPAIFYKFNLANVTNQTQFNGALSKLFQQLRGKAASGGYYIKYASGNMSIPSSYETIYGIMQCSPDLTPSLCGNCLVNATTVLSYVNDGKVGGRIWLKYSCLLRYETYLFYNQTSSPPNPSPPSTPLTHSPPSSSSPFVPPPPPLPRGHKKRSKKVIIGPAVATSAIMIIAVFSIFLKIRRMPRRKGEDPFSMSDDDTGEINYFKLSAMEAVTNKFSDTNKLGEGGYGPVYWGELPGGKKIAVKRLSQNSSQGLEEFKTEVKLIVKLQHKNLVRLLGCCIKGNERLLVYEYMANSSLDAYLFDPRKGKELDWAKRVKIVSGISKGLRYLHEDSRLKIIHRDLKASNVLLDEEMNPKISDFGTARIFGVNQIEANTDRVVGTFGYMAPEYAMEGLFSIKSDVYSFGILLLEIICGRRNNKIFHQEHDQNLLSYAWMLWKEGKGEQLIDGNLNDDCPVNEALKWMNIALLCIQEDPKDRPTMSSVAFMLESEWTSLPEPKPPMSFAKIIISDQSASVGDDIRFCSPNNTMHEEDH